MAMHYQFAMRKGFPFFDRINYLILRIVDNGLASKWLDESRVNIKKILVPSYEDLERHLDLDRILCAFILLGVGFVVSIGVFLLELIYYKSHKA